MDINTQINEANRLLTGIEDGVLDANDSFLIADKLDPVLVAIIVKFLRQKYKSRPEESGIITRILEISKVYGEFVNKIQEGESDPIFEWFEETYSYRDYYSQPEKLIEVVIDKLEG